MRKVLDIPAGKKKNLKIPPIIKNSPFSIKLRFIEGFFDADGYVNPNCTKITFVQKSPDILNEVKGILEGIDINSSKVYWDRKATCWVMSIKGKKNIERFNL